MSATDAALALAGIAAAVAGIGGGMLNDHVLPDQGFGPSSLLAVPLAMLLAGIGVLVLSIRRAGKPEAAEPASSASTWLAAPGLWFAAFLGWCALSLAVSRFPHASLSTLFLFATALGVGLVAARTGAKPGRVAAVIALACAAGTWVAVAGVQEYVVQWRQNHNPLWRVFGQFVNPDFLAGYLLLVIPATAGLLLAVRERAGRALAACAVLVQVACLTLTGSRLGLAALCLSLVAMAALALRSGALSTGARRAAMVAAVVVVAAVGVAGKPLLRRLTSSGTEAYSAQFRLYTWRGTLRIARAHPLLGTGIGTFEAAYPPYAVVGYTQHAHDSYLQLAGETGFVGATLFVAGLLATLAVGARAAGRGGPLRDVGTRPREEGADRARAAEVPPSGSHGVTDQTAQRPLLAAGLVAGVLGSAIHGLFDSDLYIPATVVTFGLFCGATAALARSGEEQGQASAAGMAPRLLQIGRWAAAAAALAAVVWSGMVAVGRLTAVEAAAALAAGDAATARDRYAAAVAVDTLNPDYRLSEAQAAARSGQAEEALRAYRAAIAAAPTAKAYRQYGRVLQSMGRMEEAISAFQQALQSEPHNLQTMLAIADAYKEAGHAAQAERTYRDIVALASTPFGRVRAVPELVDWEYGMADLGIGEAERDRKDLQAAEIDMARGAGILAEFWRQRSLLIAQIRYPVGSEVRAMTADRLASGLQELASVQERLGERAAAAATRDRLDRFSHERAAEPPPQDSGA